MAKDKITFLCGGCGYIAPSYMGRCPECQSWGSFEEQRIIAAKPSTQKIRGLQDASKPKKVVSLQAITSESGQRFFSGYGEIDRVLGGGIMPGSYVLIGGDPGIGKSTLMLQAAGRIAAQGRNVLYIAGEESPYQIKMRAERLDISSDNIFIMAETQIQQVVDAIKQEQPDWVVIDSIQSLYCPDVSGTPGSVSQIKECASWLMETAKTLNIPIFIIGHVTKDGGVAGPKLLEHTVDAVLYLEGDKYQDLRVLRTVKNRFGSTHEIGVFQMNEAGLREVPNPSELFLNSNVSQNQPGSVITATMEGSRPILVEIQALVGQSAYSTPRRVGIGVEQNRLHQIVAVLERRLGLDFSRQDIYVNVVGGLRIDETAADLGMAIAIISSQRNLSVMPGTVVTGEVGLTGEIRPVRQLPQRLQEAARIGFKRMLAPNSDEATAAGDLKLVSVSNMMDAVKSCFAPSGSGEKRIDESEELINV